MAHVSQPHICDFSCDVRPIEGKSILHSNINLNSLVSKAIENEVHMVIEKHPLFSKVEQEVFGQKQYRREIPAKIDAQFAFYKKLGFEDNLGIVYNTKFQLVVRSN